MDALQPWMGQLGIGAASIVLFVTIGRSYVNSVSKRVTEVRDQYEKGLEKLEKSWESRLTDMRERAEAWEAAASVRDETAREMVAASRRVESVMEQNIALLKAIREGQVQ